MATNSKRDIDIQIKNAKLKSRSIGRKIFDFIINIDIDFAFVALATLALPSYAWWTRILMSIGFTYIYKKVIKDVMKIKYIK